MVKLDQLETITMYMDVPSFRRRNVRWLRKNLKKRNADHPKYEDAMNLIEELYKRGIHHG